MWVVAKCKSNEQNLFEKNINIKMSEKVKIFNPKIKLNFFKKNKLVAKTKPLLNNYLFCFHKEFSNPKTLQKISNTKGLMYLLNGSNLCQDEIENFIKYCKFHEDKNGYIKQNFLEISHNKFYKFVSGPFTNLVFKLIEKNNNKIKILIDKAIVVVKKNSDYCYQSI